MNILKRILVGTLIAAMLVTPFTSCQKQPAAAEDTTEDAAAATEGTGVETPVEPIVLCDATTSYYRIVRPTASPIEVSDASNAIMEYPGANGGRNLTLKWSSDKSEATEHEILIGYTNRPESLEVLKSIDYDDFAIVSKNGKIVIAAHKAERMAEAAAYLCNNLLQVRTNESGKKELVYLGDYVFKGNQKYLFNLTDGTKPEDFVIVYKKDSDNLLEAAKVLQAALKDTYGTEISIVDDSVAERECEILIGKVNRDIVKEYFKEDSNISRFSYVTAVKGKKLLVAAQSDQVTDFMIEAFCNQYISASYSYLFNIAADTEDVNNAFSFSDPTELAEGADMRVMSFNILCELWNDKAVIAGREIPVIAPIYTYMPDILGLQEVSDAWYVALEPLFEGSYAFVDKKTTKGETNFSPLLYNVETMTLLEHGVVSLKVGGNGLRVLSWGYFERKSDGARFVAINTHWNVGDSNDAQKTADQVAQATEMAEFVLSMQKKYNCPIISTGDYNSRLSQDPIKTYMTNSGMVDACQSAKVVNRSIKTTHTLFTESHRGAGEAIDHVFASPEVELLFYNVLIDECLAPSSDHNPIYADIKLK